LGLFKQLNKEHAGVTIWTTCCVWWLSKWWLW